MARSPQGASLAPFEIFVINNVTLHRVPDGAEVPVFNLSLSLDAASWTWGFEASLPATAESLVDPGAESGPVELLASVNGTAFRALAENISRERIFGDARIRISGRGRNAVLAAPYAPVMTFSNAEGRTARQLMDDVLTINGVPLARLSQLAVAFLQIGLFCARKCLIRIEQVGANACSEDFSRCGQAARFLQ